MAERLNPNSERDRGARPPRAQFSAPSRKTPAAENSAEDENPSPAENAGREGASSNAWGGRAPQTSEFGLRILVNGKPLVVPAGTIVAAAVELAGERHFRNSVTGEPRSPLCGMGVCFECRVTINGQPHSRSCLTLCEEGMEVRTDE